jgi:hypothetical protein
MKRSTPQKPAIELPPNSNWIPVKFGPKDSQRHSTVLCHCATCPPGRSETLWPVRLDHLTAGKSLQCRSCSAVARASQQADNGRKSAEQVIEKMEDASLSPNLSLEVGTTGGRNPASSKVQAVPFSQRFLQSLKTTTVGDLTRQFHWQQPPQIEQILSKSDLSMSRGRGLRGGQNFILAGTNPKKHLSSDGQIPLTLRLRFGADKKTRRSRIKGMLCPSGHGEQVVKSTSRGKFNLACGCWRRRDIQA